MKSPPLDEMPDDVRALLDAEARTIERVPAEVERSLAARLAPMWTPAGAAGGAAAAGASKLVAWKILAAFLLGAGLGAGAVAVARPTPAVEIRTVERVVERVVERPPPEPAATSSAPSPPASSASTARPPRAQSSVDADLARERLLIDTARSAVARRDGAAALAATDDHARTFPRGRLSEEREALAIQALMISGRDQEAAARARRFRTQYPNGLLLPVVDAALRERDPSR